MAEEGSAAEEPAAHPPAHAEEEAHPSIHTATLHERKPHVFPPRGADNRQELRQVFSEPTLRRGVFGADCTYPQESVDVAKYRKGLASMLQGLEQQTQKRRAMKRRRRDSEKFVARMKESYYRSLDEARVGNEKPAWTYCDPAGYFENPLPVDGTESLVCSRRPNNGIYETNDPRYRPPHSESNVLGGWNYHTHNLKNQILDEFGTKGYKQLSPTERKFADRLDQSIKKQTELINKDALEKTQGWVKKQKLFSSASEFSALKGTQPVWAEQRNTTHTYFSSPEAYKPGEREYESGLQYYIETSDRTTSFKRDFVIGHQGQTSNWRGPKGGVSGSIRRRAQAQALLCPKGCPSLIPADSKAALKASGKLESFKGSGKLVKYALPPGA